MHKFLKYAVEEAAKSTFRQRVGAIIYRKNKIVSYGHNDAQRSVKGIIKKFQKWPNSIHAEVAAIINAKADLKNASLLVVRVNDGKLMLSKPCNYCLMYMIYVGIKKVYYSIDRYPYIVEMNLRDINENDIKLDRNKIYEISTD